MPFNLCKWCGQDLDVLERALTICSITGERINLSTKFCNEYCVLRYLIDRLYYGPADTENN